MGKSGNWSSTKNLHNLSLLFHLPSSKNFGATLSFRWRSGVNTGKSHSRRRKEKEIDPSWPDDLEVMLGKVLRTYWRWICGRKKQQSQSQRPVNGCHCLCDCYWRKGSKSGKISQIVINIINARKTIVLLHSGSPQMDLRVDLRAFPLTLHPLPCMIRDRFTHVKNWREEVKVYPNYIWTDCEACDPFPLHFCVHKSITWADFYAVMLTALSQTMQKYCTKRKCLLIFVVLLILLFSGYTPERRRRFILLLVIFPP